MTSTMYLTECETRDFDLSSGATEYLWIDLADQRKQDITTAVVSISLGTYDAPTTWQAVNQFEQNGPVWQVRVALLIGGAFIPAPGAYWAWTKTVLGVETVIQRAENKLVRIS